MLAWLFRKIAGRRDSVPPRRSARPADAGAADPENADALHLLGIAALERGAQDEAVNLLSRSVALDAANPSVHIDLGRALKARGELPRAEASFRAALALAPQDATLHFLLGNTLVAQGRMQDAIPCYRNALRLKPGFPEASSNLGNVLKDLGQVDGAIACYQDAVRIRPDFVEAQFNLGLAYRQLAQSGRAIACFETVVGLRPDLAEAQYLLGCLYANEDRRAEALACFRNALSRQPEYAEARWGQAMSQLLAVCGPADDPARGREAFAAELEQLERWFGASRIASGAQAVGSLQPFRLAYQEQNNRDLLGRYGRLCVRLMQPWSERELRPPAGRRNKAGAIRVAIVSRYFSNHSVWNAITKGWFQRLDRARFSLIGFHLGSEEDAQTQFARTRAVHFEHGTRGLRQWADAILDQQPDAVIYPEIGMDPMTLRLACLRLAPVQLASWGHPETTGLPTIDRYLSAEDFEPPGARDHYTEQLVALPHLGCYVEPSGLGTIVPDLERWGIGRNGPLLICPGTPFKYSPEHDHVLPRIAARLGKCQFVFFTYSMRSLTERLRLRLEGAFRDHGLDPDDHLRFIPWLDPPAFYGLMRRADVFLDCIGFSGFNTALQAIECALPVVTREGRFMRGRLASGLLKRLGLPELVAGDEQEYVALAVKLVEDASYGKGVRERLAVRQAALFRDDAPIRALEELLVKATGRAAA